MHTNNCYLGLDLGGTKALVILTRADGRVLEETTFKTEAQLGPDKVLRRLLVALQELQNKSPTPPAGLGIGVAGQVDQKSGKLYFAPNLKWKDVSLGEYFEKNLKIPVTVLNDVRAGVWGERMFGAAQGYDDVLGIFIGTGIGGGLVSDGRLLMGSTGTACEIGHVSVDFHGPQCTCGNIGCVEAYAGGWGIARQAQTLLTETSEENELTAKDVIALYQAKHPLAIKVLDQAVKALSTALVTYIHSYNPKLVVFGGGIVDGWSELPDLVMAEAKKLAIKAAVKEIEWKNAGLKNYAVAVGAAAYAKTCHLNS